MHVAAHYSAKVASSIVLVFLTYFLLATGSDSEATGVYQEPPFDLESVESHARLQALPPPSSDPYDGTGNPTVVVTHAYQGGGLNHVLHRAEVWTHDAGGIDLCGERFILDDFAVFYPAGGASDSDVNVTYVSNSNDPSGEECNLRASPGKKWHYRVCVEYDGSLDAPRPGVFDDWDACLEGSASSSTGFLLPASWEAI